MAVKQKYKALKVLAWLLGICFIFINVVAFFHAYKFTHFADENSSKTVSPNALSPSQKLSTLIFGVNNPRPQNEKTPSANFETITLNSNKKIECWLIKTPNSKGTVVLFHGFSAQKSSMLNKAEVFRAQGFNTLLVDFMGSGGSEGRQTTIGFLEAQQVKTCFEYLVQNGENNCFLLGTSMGAVAIMKAIHDFQIKPKGIIIECPFGSMYQTVCARFKSMNAPAFPMAGLLVFWGGVQNGFWAFDHQPTSYAKRINCPTLLMHGLQDEKVSKAEIDEIMTNLAGPKLLKTYKNAGHEDYLIKYKSEWSQDVADFMCGELK